MPITLRTRPTCHYCGKRNSPSNNPYKFTCQHCQSENYLDEAGQIVDVPASTTSSVKQYAVPITSAFVKPEGSIFCSTCLKNQYMYNSALSEYLPDPEHPEYDQFEAAIPAFKKDLERRFPTCCAGCEPLVKAQLHQATYSARSDHVRRVLDRSRQRRNASTWGWRYLVVNAAGLGWLLSLIVQLVWHALGSQVQREVGLPNIRPAECLSTWPVPAHCPHLVEELIGPALVLGFLCIWWNPKWQHRLQGREGRLVGLDKFYKVQGVLLALRFASWTIIKDVPTRVDFKSMIHGISLVLLSMITGWSCFGIIKIYNPRIVNWSQDPAPLLDSKQYVPPIQTQEISPPNSQQEVPLDMFNTAVTRGIQVWRPPTPPVDEDVMEWDPTPTTFNPNPKTIKYKSTNSTPFRGTLPALPRGGIYNTRNEVTLEQPKAIGLPRGFFDKSHGKTLGPKTQTSTAYAGLAEPKFFADAGKADTGLENIFDKVFSLTDGAKIPTGNANIPVMATNSVESELAAEPLNLTTNRKADFGVVYNALTAVLLALYTTIFSVSWWGDLPILPYFIGEDSTYGLMVATVVDAVLSWFLKRKSDTVSIRVIKAIASVPPFILLLAMHSMRPDVRDRALWNRCLIFFFTGILVLKIWSLCLAYSWSQDHQPAKVPEQNTRELLQATNPFLKPPQEVSAPPNLRRSSSDESLTSIASTASIATTSTASGWKTPVRNHREELRTRTGSNSTPYGFGGLTIKNDFGSGAGIAGPRTRKGPDRGGQSAW